MTILAKVICDSVSPAGVRLLSMQVTMHRYVLAEFNTHRVFSRNFRSSRAVPVAKLIQEVRLSPAEPASWRAEKRGMQGGDELEGEALKRVQDDWRAAAYDASVHAEIMMRDGLHKSWANRVIEPYLYVHGVVTSTEWSNFFALRCHPDAQPEIRVLAEAMREAMDRSEPVRLVPGQWHLPYVDGGRDAADEDVMIKMSVARCARVSYKNHDGSPTSAEDDMKLYEKLVGAQPMHASPAEHQATPDEFEHRLGKWKNPHLHGNFRGWVQYRKTLEGECQ